MAYRTKNFDQVSPFLLICDHASNEVPDEYDNLSLDKESLQKHYALDIGAADVTEALSGFLKAPAVFGAVSRLVIDVNRPLDHPTLIVSEGEGQVIPGNRDISAEDRQKRIVTYYHPFHELIGEKVQMMRTQCGVPLLVSVHSYTPHFFQQKRIWDIGFLWAQDNRAAKYMIRFFRKRGFCVGDNEPYDARMLGGTTLNRHADAARLPNVLVEIRNDLIDTPEKAAYWAELLAQALQEIQALPQMFTLYDGPAMCCDPAEAARYFEKIIMQAKSGWPARET